MTEQSAGADGSAGSDRSSRLRATHGWLMRPGQDLPAERRELFAVTLYACLCGLFAYVVYTPLFVEIGATRLAAANGVAIGVFVVALVAVLRGHVFTGMTMASTGMAVHAWFTAVALGGACGFQLHVLLALELGLLFTYVPLWFRLVYAAAFSLTYLGLVDTLARTSATVLVSEATQRSFELLNSAVFAAVTVLIATFYAWSVRRNRDVREQVLRDLEARNETLRVAHAQLAEARDAAQEASKTKSMFLANMSHELRTPLNAIIGYSEMIQEDAVEEQNAGLADEAGRIMGAGRHLLALINDILDLAKIEARQMECERIEFSLGDVVVDVLNTVEPLAAARDNALTHELDAGIRPLCTDPTKVRQILFNLLSNACKFTEHGTIALRVVSDDRPNEEGVRFEVRDTGIGIPADKLEHIFGEFSQADGTTTRRFGGTGLGLAITRQFCEMLGGEITVRSDEGSGSEFEVWLPLVLRNDGSPIPSESVSAPEA